MSQGDYVGHSYFGKGVVIAEVGSTYVEIDFGFPFGIKTVPKKTVQPLAILQPV